MTKGLQNGATVKNGYEMLLNQAIKSYEIWNEESPS
jgi:shikimate dehydrogenase